MIALEFLSMKLQSLGGFGIPKQGDRRKLEIAESLKKNIDKH